MKKVTARYLGRRVYEVIAEGKDGKIVRKQFREPVFNDPKKYATKIENLVNEFAIDDLEVEKQAICNQLVAASQKAERDFPNLMV